MSQTRRFRGRYVSRSEFERYEGSVNAELARLWRRVRALEHPDNATHIILTIGGTMPGQITVDTTNETATLAFVDDKGNVTTGPDGAQFEFDSDNPDVATVAPDSNNPLQADITPVALGTANISATSNGTALENDGETPIPDPDPVQVTVSPGAAAGESFTLSV